ncbi:Methionine-binding lipoprotein metQ precursor [Sebaldella termitidis]|jgi:D-methionine transport system substrate-binding protein|uniref:Lipoprotein n=1 Tax=Sebaldella termitidis (strain ATCC 33386 / NCTC 11300) TaxID=526218 RepID=D1AK63_SEBTE|nr:MetQ/NlpA family ABC transporter substrate-binding protein [Sebaldella termitidis]ACZ08979.1 NLPA lipoprotein [Sebaldella termitidis ATCC 33386]SUI24298.1 Methionine-binding lipoprotein metQ precursor [Sebaldella termitidis]
MKKFLIGILTLGVIFSCGKKEETPAADTGNPEAQKEQKLVIGATPTPHAEILEQVKEELKKEGVDLEIKIFDDYVLPNRLLGEKTLDANYFQHVPYMEEFAQKNNMELVAVAKIHVEPLAVYSKSVKDLSELPEGADVLIPNDPTNRGRALILLDKSGIIKLKDNQKLDSTIEDIAENPKKLKVTALNADQIPTRLGEVGAAVINGNFAMKNNLNPLTDSIFIEDKDSPYANVITVLKGNENDERVQKLVKALQSEKIKKFIEEKYQGSVVPAF